jgi:hypothetical protein
VPKRRFAREKLRIVGARSGGQGGSTARAADASNGNVVGAEHEDQPPEADSARGEPAADGAASAREPATGADPLAPPDGEALDGQADEGDASDGEALEAHYDPRELERLAAVSFSAGELSDFAHKFGIFTSRDGDAREGARTLVRGMARREALAELVDELRLAKPLVEWPEPEWRAARQPPAAAPTAADPSAATGAEPRASSAEGDRGEASIRDPFAMLDDDEAPGTGLPPRLWLMIGAAVVVAGLVGGGIVLLATAKPDGPPRPEDGPVSIAQRASSHLRDAVGAVARACDAEVTTRSARDSLATAFRRCASPDGPVPSGRAAGPALPPLFPSVQPRPPGVAPPPPREAPRPSGPRRCLDRCETQHRECIQSKCGPEPTEGSKYDAYQRCLGGCLTSSSRCRLTCR